MYSSSGIFFTATRHSTSGHCFLAVASARFAMYGLQMIIPESTLIPSFSSKALVRVKFSPVFVAFFSIKIFSFGTPISMHFFAKTLPSSSFQISRVILPNPPLQTMSGAIFSANSSDAKTGTIKSWLPSANKKSAFSVG